MNKLYEDTALDRISEERYQSMASAYEREQEALKGQCEGLSAEIAQGEEVDIYYKFIGYVNMRKLLENGVWCEQETPEGQRPVLVKPA